MNRAYVIGTICMLTLVLPGCEGSKNRELAQGFVAQFEKIVEQRKTLDQLEAEGKQYDQRLEEDVQEPNATKRAKALGVWVGESRAMVSQAKSVADAQSTIIDAMVADSVKLSGDAAKYAREATDALRDYVSIQRREADIAEQVITLIDSHIGEPSGIDAKQLEELTKPLEDLDAKENQAFQRSQDGVVRLRAAAGLP